MDGWANFYIHGMGSRGDYGGMRLFREDEVIALKAKQTAETDSP